VQPIGQPEEGEDAPSSLPVLRTTLTRVYTELDRGAKGTKVWRIQHMCVCQSRQGHVQMLTGTRLQQHYQEIVARKARGSGRSRSRARNPRVLRRLPRHQPRSYVTQPELPQPQSMEYESRLVESGFAAEVDGSSHGIASCPQEEAFDTIPEEQSTGEEASN
jgi:hypothetical protein